MYRTVCKDTIAEIIDIHQSIHDLAIVWTIRDDQLQPLRWRRKACNQISRQRNNTVEPTSEPRIRNYIHPISPFLANSCEDTTHITFEQLVAEFIAGVRVCSVRMHV